MTRLVSEPFRIAHANIRGTPKMRAEQVAEDLETIAGKAGILALVEFKWQYYWQILGRLLRISLPGVRRRRKGRPVWRTYPGLARGIAAPIFGGQMFAWKGERWKRIKAKRWLLHKGAPGISEDRQIRHVLLADRAVQLALKVSLIVTHNVVGGDNRGDSAQRRGILAEDIDHIVEAVRWAKRLGHPVVLMLDANIHRSSTVYREFVRRVVTELGGEIVGDADGVEYVIVYQGSNGTTFVVDAEWEIGLGQLNTDHEVRGLTGHLEGPRQAA